MTPSDFYDMTPREWGNLVRGWNEKENRRNQQDWERTRWMTSILLNPHTKKRIQPKDLIVFPWETKKKERTVWSRGEILDLIEQRRERAKAKLNGVN